ncbi:MAG TPA: right-handed parallel beta-helix repeat-containing protein [Phycisphaerae bacterium]|nr:right-handed parallel beta-helix repeat-containing protein [Phycisphaerae bacterium]
MPARALPVALLLLGLPLIQANRTQGAETIYVDGAAPSGGDGQSWGTAFNDLQDALQAAQAGDTIRVAGGIYTPAGPDGPRTATFELKNNVVMLGGYAGQGSLNPTERDVSLHETTLSGDLYDNDVPGSIDCCVGTLFDGGCSDADCTAAVCAANASCCTQWDDGICTELAEQLCPDLCAANDDNVYHVVVGIENAPSTVIDGFTIRGGFADTHESDGTLWGSYGGGIYIEAGEPTVRHCRFENNWASDGGGALITSGQVLDCTFSANSATRGGAIGLSHSGTARRCVFSHNEALDEGGAATLLGDASLEDCTFTNNRSGLLGGAVATRFADNPTLRRCTFASNRSPWGGAVLLNSRFGVLLADCRFEGNSSTGRGGAIACYAHSADLIANVFVQNLADIGGGAVHMGGESGRLHDCLFAGNSSGAGGALMFQSSTDVATITHSTFFANTAQTIGGGLHNSLTANITVANSIFWGNLVSPSNDSESAQISNPATTVTHTCIQGLNAFAAQVGNIGADPLMVDTLGADSVAGTGDYDLRLAAGSPCIDAADNAAVPPDTLDLDGDGDVTEPSPFDAAGRTRFWDDPATPDCPQPGASCGTAPLADMGAFEFGAPAPLPGDYDHDGTVGPADYIWFANCLGGPGQDPAAPLVEYACRAAFDVDADHDVDLRDFAAFAQSLGTNR